MSDRNAAAAAAGAAPMAAAAGASAPAQPRRLRRQRPRRGEIGGFGVASGAAVAALLFAPPASARQLPALSAHAPLASGAAPAAALAQQRPCSDEELSSFALALAAGPAPGRRAPRSPGCVPSEAQALWPLGAPAGPPLHLTALTAANASLPPGAALGSFAAKAHGESESRGNASTAPAHLLHLYVAQSFEDWCSSPCQGPTWELAAPKPADTGASPYVLLEAAIWRQERRVALYQFDEAWMERARRTYFSVCNGKGWECPSYRFFRESRRLMEVGPWPASADTNPEELSRYLHDAFQKVFEKALETAPGAAHIALTYSGHGARADGSLFEGSLHKDDAVSLLKYVTGAEPDDGGDDGSDAAGQGVSAIQHSATVGRSALAAGQLSMLNFGGNCAEGRWNMLAAMHPFAEWVLASDLNVGGAQLTKEESTSETMAAHERLGDCNVIMQGAEAKLDPRTIAENLIQSRQKIWETIWKGPIERQELEQSISAFDTSNFRRFRRALRHRHGQLSAEQRTEFKEKVEGFECDVLKASELLDSYTASEGAAAEAQTTNLLARSRALSLLAAAESHRRLPELNSSMSLAGLFKEFRAMYTDTRPMTTWKTDAHGLGFNYLGWKGPPCDLATALNASTSSEL